MSAGSDAPLSAPEVARLLDADPGAVVIGGQALGLWALFYGIPLPAELNGIVTRDLDFFGDRKLAELFASRLERAEVRVPSVDDHATPNSAIVLVRRFGDPPRTVQVDFLGAIKGLDGEKVKLRAATVSLDGVSHPTRIMHPMDCLTSRIANLALPAKRNAQGAAQARIAIYVTSPAPT